MTATRPTLGPHDRVPARSRRAAFFIWFALIGIPTLLFGLSLAADVSSVVNVNRQVRLAAESASLAGAFQYRNDGSGRLDPVRAEAVARQTFQHAINMGAVKRADIQAFSAIASDTTVSFRVTYQITGLLAIRWFMPAGVAPISIGERSRVCNVNQSGNTSGTVCGRPGTEGLGGGVDNDNDGYTSHYPAHYPEHYPLHYPGHYPRHYPKHYPGNYAAHYPLHYGRHYPRHYPRNYPTNYPSFRTPR